MPDKHIRFSLEESLNIKVYANSKGISFNKAVKELVSYSLKVHQENEYFLKIIEKLDKAGYKINNVLSLLEQLYSDLDFANLSNPKLSKSLIEFKKRNRSNKIID